MTKRALGVSLAAFVFLADQASKYWALEIYQSAGRAPLRLLPFLDLTLVWNQGVSYGHLPLHPMLLLAFSLLASVCLAVWLWRAASRLTAAGAGLILGGALGNALDRATHGAVADFLDFHTPFWAGPLSNYVFNIADVGIVAGAGVLLYEAFVEGSRPPSAPKA